MKTKEEREETKENLIAFVVVAVIIVALSWWIWSAVHTSPPEPRVPLALGLSPVLGNGSVTVVEFTDFECSFCGDFARNEFPRIKQELIDTGKIRFVIKHYPLPMHQQAVPAAIAAVCAQEQEKFWEYAEELFANQEQLDSLALRRRAQNLGLNMTMFDRCVATDNVQLTLDKDAGTRAGVTGTPTFFFNGRKVVGVLTYDQLKAEVEAEWAETS